MALPFRCAVLFPLLLSGCNAKREADAPTQREQAAIAGTAATSDQIDDARSYLAPFVTADPDSCFREVALGDAQMVPRADRPFAATVETKRVVIAIDGSGSMAARIGSRAKLDLAKESTLAFIRSLDADVDAALIVFGQQGSNAESGKVRSCAAVDRLSPMTRDRQALTRAVADVRAVGWTPLAAALRSAQSQLAASATPGEQVIYVVSDGNETCGGDPVAVARAINTGPARAVVNIIGFDLPASDRAALRTVAGAGGGTLVNIADDAAYQRTLVTLREAARRNRNTIAGSAARTANIIGAGTAITHATLCTGQIMTRETLRVGADLTRRASRKEPAPDRALVFRILDQRHVAMKQRRDAYAAELKGARDRTNDGIGAREKNAE